MSFSAGCLQYVLALLGLHVVAACGDGGTVGGGSDEVGSSDAGSSSGTLGSSDDDSSDTLGSSDGGTVGSSDGGTSSSAGPTTTVADTTGDTSESSTSTPPMCGDGVVDEGEACDDGGESAECNADCTEASCGDGIANATAGEACDDGGESATCDADCTASECGDGTVNAAAGEACEGGESPTCDADCTAVACPDGTVNASAGEHCDDGNVMPDDGCAPDCTNEFKLAFVSSELYTGDMGGLAGADASCQELADAAGLPGSYLAWLSTSTESPSTRFTQSTFPYVRVDGEQIADDWIDLTDEALDSPLDVTELGGPAPGGTTNCAGDDAPSVWTGTSGAGAWGGTSLCEDWTATTGSALWGLATSTSLWTVQCASRGEACAWLAAIYCFQQ